MLSIIGLLLFCLIFYVISSHPGGSFGDRIDQTVVWIHAWAPFSYILIGLILISPIVVFKIMHSWPEYKEPESPMARYKNGEDVMTDD